MSKAMNSPTARMLRSSRLFSLPPPLPQPAMELLTRAGQVKVSDTATQPYPTRQAITAPASSRNRGDWGLKRPLPDKTNNTSSPHVRINAIDTLEHITDFDSAADHTLSLEKWQEMNIHMASRPDSTATHIYPTTPGPSAFSSIMDNTTLPQDRPQGGRLSSLPLGAERSLRIRGSKNGGVATPADRRWKFLGPSLAVMPEAEFDRYVRRLVESPEMRAQFRRFLLFVLKKEKRDKALAAIRQEHGFDPENEGDVKRLADAARIKEPDQELDAFMLQLRNDNTDLSAKLSRLIGEFFDLPPFPEVTFASIKTTTTGHTRANSDIKPAIPPVHPSAGLSYIQTPAFIENHALHGPQLDHTPVEARVLRPRDASTGQHEFALLGLGGFAARDFSFKTYKGTKDNNAATKTKQWDFEDPEFNKLWVKALYGFVDEAGKVRMKIEHADREAVAVKTGGPDPRLPLQPEETEAQTRERIKREASNHGASYRQEGSVAVKTARRPKGLAANHVTDWQKGMKQAATEGDPQKAGRSFVEALQSSTGRRKGGL